MTLEKAKQELEKFVQLKTTLRPSFVDVLLNAEEVKHGHWITLTEQSLMCSACSSIAPYQEDYYGTVVKAPRYKFCPNCGAKMDEVT